MVFSEPKEQKNHAFIDSQNLNLAIREQGWVLDFNRFHRYLEDKYKASKAFLFIGFVPLYERIEREVRTQKWVKKRGITSGTKPLG